MKIRVVKKSDVKVNPVNPVNPVKPTLFQSISALVKQSLENVQANKQNEQMKFYGQFTEAN